METRDVWARPGTICAFLAAWGSCGLYISHSCVDSRFPPSGWLIMIGFSVCLMLISGAPGWRKWPVAPASAMPKSLLICMGLANLWATS